jgi:DnaJ-class molecular chaperone
VKQHKTLQVKIPKGVVEGARVRLAGMGGKGAHGGSPGDLFLRVQLLPHRTFQTRGNNLYGDLPVLDYETALGAEIQVPTLDGPVWMKIPPGTQAGTQLRLKGKGLPHFQGEERGDLYFSVKIVIPTNLTEQEKELLKQLRSSRQQRGETDPRKGLL